MTNGRRGIVTLTLLAWLAGGALAFADQRVIVKTRKPYAAVKQKIVAMGGTVTHEFKHADGLVAVVPDGQLDALEKLLGVDYVVRDEVVPNPGPREAVSLAGEAPFTIEPASLPANYHSYNSELTNVLPLQLEGFLGQGVVVGVIDSGVSATATALCSTSPCTAASTRVIGGESLVPGATEPGPNAATNDPHGTWVATMIGANAAFGFTRAGALASAVRSYCTPASTFPCSFQASPTVDGIYMVGQAPQARFYAFKVFPASGGGAPTSRLLQAMDRAIELRNTTLPEMKVVNMSLGGVTLRAGGDLEDELAASMAAAGISLVVSAGNTGPSGSTVGSPGTARNILTVGAASSPVHERILRDVQFGPGIGPLYRPDSNQQIADFSSRGPNADGRTDPEVVANGHAGFAQGANGSISLVSGTSFSAPTVSGILAALYSYKPAATPSEMRSAIVLSARSDVIPTAKRVDQGAGYVNAAGARDVLDRRWIPRVGDFGLASRSVALNVLLGAGIIPIDLSDFRTHLKLLRPAERREFYYMVRPHTRAVHLTVSNLAPELPVAEQNQLFGDDLLVAVHSAKTSSVGEAGDYLAAEYVNGNKTWVFKNPETGLMRITILGDSTNAGRISADVRIQEDKAPLPRAEFRGELSEGEFRTHETTIAPGTTSVTFRLSWDNDWGAYPTNDLDLILVSPTGVAVFDGATLDSPETVTITNPVAGTWTMFVDGFTIAGKKERYQLRIDIP
jgi:hypothetical protein